ncbi:MAG TPA: hypothetical protein VJH92_04435 [Candidatus Nanoarchaeia archaeon]|nr:hypothetical protein [Candidatus Nanoarchaeia archaeon]
MGKKFNLTIIGIFCLVLATFIFYIIKEGGNTTFWVWVFIIPLIFWLYLFFKSINDNKFYPKYKITITISAVSMLIDLFLIIFAYKDFLKNGGDGFGMLGVGVVVIFGTVVIFLASLMAFIVQKVTSRKK